MLCQQPKEVITYFTGFWNPDISSIWGKITNTAYFYPKFYWLAFFFTYKGICQIRRLNSIFMIKQPLQLLHKISDPAPDKMFCHKIYLFYLTWRWISNYYIPWTSCCFCYEIFEPIPRIYAALLSTSLVYWVLEMPQCSPGDELVVEINLKVDVFFLHLSATTTGFLCQGYRFILLYITRQWTHVTVDDIKPVLIASDNEKALTLHHTKLSKNK